MVDVGEMSADVGGFVVFNGFSSRLYIWGCQRMSATPSSETVFLGFFRVCFGARRLCASPFLGFPGLRRCLLVPAMSVVQPDAKALTCKLCHRCLPAGSSGRLHRKHWTCRVMSRWTKHIFASGKLKDTASRAKQPPKKFQAKKTTCENSTLWQTLFYLKRT